MTFPDPEKPNRAEVINPKSKKKYIVRDCYSMLPSCNCPWAVQGNICKHQCKALMCKGHQGGSIIQQCGTWSGSQYQGIRPIDQSMLWADNSKLLLEHGAHLEPMQDFTLGDVNFHDGSLIAIEERNRNVRDICVDKSRETWIQIEKMASQSDSIAQTTLVVMKRSLHDLKVQEQCQQACGRDLCTTADMFVRPSGLTLKRRLGVVDKYHGGKRIQRIVKGYLQRKRGQNRPTNSLVSSPTKVL